MTVSIEAISLENILLKVSSKYTLIYLKGIEYSVISVPWWVWTEYEANYSHLMGYIRQKF